MARRKVREGLIVHYVLNREEGEKAIGQHVPAMIVRIWNHTSGLVNLTIFPDWSNNASHFDKGIAWRTSRLYSEEKLPGTWHWIEP